MNNNQHHYLNELNFPTNRDLKNLFGSFYNPAGKPGRFKLEQFRAKAGS